MDEVIITVLQSVNHCKLKGLVTMVTVINSGLRLMVSQDNANKQSLIYLDPSIHLSLLMLI